jgi:hypothetical protein
LRDFLPTGILHGFASPDFLTSRASQTLASLQSRTTVSGQTPNTSAVSSMLSPPKKRNSTTRLLRSSIKANKMGVEFHQFHAAHGFILAKVLAGESFALAAS